LNPLIEEKQRVLRAIWRAKMHVEPTALELSPPAIRDSFAHIWEPADLWMHQALVFPLGLLRLWQSIAGGHVVFTHQASRYLPGTQSWQHHTLMSVCFLSVTDLRQDPRNALLAWLALCDHIMGSGAVEDGVWLSSGGGVTPALCAVGARFVHIHALGYGHHELGVRSARDYLSHTLWLYVYAPQRLNTLDPLAYKLYHSTLMNETFWPEN
jgi:hypothetical protein